MRPNFIEHARELAQEIMVARNRVRNLSHHWATDGAHKESCLRDVLNSRLPARYRAESGFIVSPDTQSSQIDILVVDKERPTVSRDAAGTIFVTPDAVKAIVEVKTRLTSGPEFAEAFRKLGDNLELCQIGTWGGLFIVESEASTSFWDGPDDKILLAAERTASIGSSPWTQRSCSCVACGPDIFIRRWTNSRSEAVGVVDGPAWHSYYMRDLAPAYFVGNLVDAVSPVPDSYSKVWFPIPDGKETTRRWHLEPEGQPLMFPEYLESCEVSGIRNPIKRAQGYEPANRKNRQAPAAAQDTHSHHSPHPASSFVGDLAAKFDHWMKNYNHPAQPDRMHLLEWLVADRGADLTGNDYALFEKLAAALTRMGYNTSSVPPKQAFIAKVREHEHRARQRS